MLVFPGFRLELAQIIFLLALFLDLFLYRFQRLQQRRLGHGFQQILLHPDLDRLFRELKVVVTADQDDFGFGQLGADHFAERQPIHERHFDIGDQNIRTQLADLRQRQLAVRRIPAKFKIVPRPIDAIAQPFADNAFVFYQKNL